MSPFGLAGLCPRRLCLTPRMLSPWSRVSGGCSAVFAMVRSCWTTSWDSWQHGHPKTCSNMGMDQYLLVPFLGGWTSINPSYFDVNYRGTRFWPIAIYVYWRRIKEKMPGTCVWVHSPSPTDCPPFGSNMNSSRRLSPWDPMKTPMFAAYTVIFHHFCQLNHCYSICLPVKLRHVSPFLVVKLVKP